MSLPDSLCSPPGVAVASGNGGSARPAHPRSPRQNLLLAALPAEDYQRLLPHLEPVALPAGWVLHDSGHPEAYLYFPISGLVARFHKLANGDSAGFALTGNEGVIGLAAFLGGASTTSHSVVLVAGDAFRLRADRLHGEMDHGAALLRLLLRYTLALIGQIGLVSACIRHHPVEQRLCRWLSFCLDRLPGREVPLTHGIIAEMLGVRRESVTMALRTLQDAGVVDCGRGHIVVLDRRRLEAHACECNEAIRREYQRLPERQPC